MVEIVAGGDFVNVVTALNLKSTACTYEYLPLKDSYRENYQVWELSKEDYEKLSSISDNEWQEDWGWWRWAKGSNMGTAYVPFTINRQLILAREGVARDEWAYECQECSDYLDGFCGGSSKDIEECFGPHEYKDILEYFCEELGASTERNITALAIDLARQNNIKLSEFFEKYLG